MFSIIEVEATAQSYNSETLVSLASNTTITITETESQLLCITEWKNSINSKGWALFRFIIPYVSLSISVLCLTVMIFLLKKRPHSTELWFLMFSSAIIVLSFLKHVWCMHWTLFLISIVFALGQTLYAYGFSNFSHVLYLKYA